MQEITINFNKNEALYFQIYKYLKEEIHAERITNGTKLPSKRNLAKYLGVSQITIETAYDQLKAEGYIYSKPRVGLFVQKIDYDIKQKRIVSQQDYKESTPTPIIKYDFNHGKIDAEHFPLKIWNTISIECMKNKENLFIGDPQGEFALRYEITQYLYESRGVKCDPEQIFIGAGTQYLISILSTVLLNELSIVGFEDPGFHRPKQVFKNFNICFKPIPLDVHGIKIDKLEESKANIVYVTPSHQFPSGVIMPITRRIELLKWANRSNSYIIEDDYDGEFRYFGKPVPSLQGIDIFNNVIYLGTFSKSLIPAARISYMILPHKLLDQHRETLLNHKQTVPRLYQETLSHFIKRGYLGRHLNRMRTIYKYKRETLVKSIADKFGESARILGDQSGLHILLEINTDLTEKELIFKALSRGIKVYPTSMYYEETDNIKKTQLLLGFGGLSENEIKLGIDELSKALLRS